jgi:hypothetical protein
MRFIDSFTLVFKAPLKLIGFTLFLSYIIGCGLGGKKFKPSILMSVYDSIHNNTVVKFDKGVKRNKNTDLARLGVPNGVVKSYIEMDYSIKEVTPNGQVGVLTEGVKYTFNKKGDETGLYNYRRNGAFHRYEWADCDSTGRIIIMYYHSLPDTTKINRIVYVYDKLGYLIEEDTYVTPTDSLFQKTIYTNDSRGNKITEEQYWLGQLSGNGTSKFIYDSAYNLVEYLDLNNHNLSHYDSNGNLTKIELLKTDGSMYKSTTFTYDNYRNQTEYCENKEPCIHFKYEYDKYGNWTKRIVIEDDKPIKYSTRRIEYY